jgi:hypothetical protein
LIARGNKLFFILQGKRKLEEEEDEAKPMKRKPRKLKPKNAAASESEETDADEVCNSETCVRPSGKFYYLLFLSNSNMLKTCKGNNISSCGR